MVVLAVLAGSLTRTFAGVIMLTLMTFGLCVPLAKRLCHGAMPPGEHRWYDVLLRVLLVCMLVAVVVGLSAKLGPVLSGSLALFPIALSSTGLILHRRISGVATAAVMANATPASAGFATELVLLHLTAVLLGTAPALCLPLLISVVWNIVFWSVRHRGGLCGSFDASANSIEAGGRPNSTSTWVTDEVIGERRRDVSAMLVSARSRQNGPRLGARQAIQLLLEYDTDLKAAAQLGFYSDRAPRAWPLLAE